MESVSCWHLDPWCHQRRSCLAGHVLGCYVQDVCPRESPAPAAKVKLEPRLQPADFKTHIEKSRGLLEVKPRQPQLPEPQGPSSAVTPEKQPQLASAVLSARRWNPLTQQSSSKRPTAGGCQISHHTRRSPSAVSSPPWLSSSKERNSVIFSHLSVSHLPGAPGTARSDVICVDCLF